MTAAADQAPPRPKYVGGSRAQLSTLLRALLASPRRRVIGLLLLGVVAVICANAVGQIRLNLWQRDFYQAIEQRDMAAFRSQLVLFTGIAGGLLAMVVAQTWLRAMAEVRLREWLTHDLLDQWLTGGRVYLLGFAGEIGVNPDQRIQQDAQRFAELGTVLLVGLLQSTLLLASFVGVLWVLSGQVLFDFGRGPVAIPGYMVWCALAYSAGGSALGWRVGRPLVALNAERYAREAELRAAVVRVAEHADGIVLNGGEADERRLLYPAVAGVVALMTLLAGGLARLTWITSGYGWLAIVVPILVAAPGYFGGHMTFGTLMMVVGAFNQVQSSLRWFVDNLPQIADWRATLQRVASFREALAGVDAIGAETGRIALGPSGTDDLVLDHLVVALPDSCASLDAPLVEIAPGERVQILGEAGAGKTRLFLALAGMWPWGEGRIGLPAGAPMVFVPQRPYMPLGRLRNALAYPADPARFDDAALHTALERLDLGHLAARLDQVERWDRQLPLDELQRLAFARLMLLRPRWVVLDDAMSALGPAHRDRLQALRHEDLDGLGLGGITLIRFGREPVLNGFWTRTLHITERPGGRCLSAAPLAAGAA